MQRVPQFSVEGSVSAALRVSGVVPPRLRGNCNVLTVIGNKLRRFSFITDRCFQKHTDFHSVTMSLTCTHTNYCQNSLQAEQVRVMKGLAIAYFCRSAVPDTRCAHRMCTKSVNISVLCVKFSCACEVR